MVILLGLTYHLHYPWSYFLDWPTTSWTWPGIKVWPKTYISTKTWNWTTTYITHGHTSWTDQLPPKLRPGIKVWPKTYILTKTWYWTTWVSTKTQRLNNDIETYWAATGKCRSKVGNAKKLTYVVWNCRALLQMDSWSQFLLCVFSLIFIRSDNRAASNPSPAAS